MLKLNKHIVLNTLLLTIVLLGASIFSTAQVTEETARKLFDEGRFGEALPHFNSDSTTEKLPVQHELADSLFEFILTRNIIYRKISQFKTDEGKMWFTDGWRKANELNNTLVIVSRLRTEYNQAPSNEIKDSIANHLLELEMNTLQLKKLTDESNMKAREAEMNYWKDAPESELLQLNAENDSINQAILQKKEIAVFNEISEEELFDDDGTEAISDSASVLSPAIENIEPLGDKVIYKVQIGAFSNSLPDYIDRLYKKLSVLRRIDTYTTEKGVVVYTIGELASLDDAVRLQNQIRIEGVSDAFVVAFINGKRITLNEAKEISVP